MGQNGDSGERTRQASVADLASGEIDRLESSLERASITRILRLQTVLDEQLRERYQTLAVLFSDIAGSTAYFETHGDLAGRKMVQRHNDLLMPIIEGQEGRVIKTIGDAIMATFPSAEGAVLAGIGMQEAVGQIRSHAKRAEDELSIRVGINFGDALVNDRDGDVYGDMVNVAARVQSQAGPDQIFVSDTVRAKLPERIRVRPAGTFTLKGKTDAYPLFEVRWVGTGRHPRPNLPATGEVALAAASSAGAPAVASAPATPAGPLQNPIFLLGLIGILVMGAAVGLGAYFGLKGSDPAPVVVRRPALEEPAGDPGTAPVDPPVDPIPEVAADPPGDTDPVDPVGTEPPADPDPVDLDGFPVEPLANDSPTPTERARTGRKSARSRKPATLRVIVAGGWGRVSVDGKFKGPTPLPPFELPAGRHVIVVRNPTRKPYRQTVRLRSGEERTLRVRLEPR